MEPPALGVKAARNALNAPVPPESTRWGHSSADRPIQSRRSRERKGADVRLIWGGRPSAKSLPSTRPSPVGSVPGKASWSRPLPAKLGNHNCGLRKRRSGRSFAKSVRRFTIPHLQAKQSFMGEGMPDVWHPHQGTKRPNQHADGRRTCRHAGEPPPPSHQPLTLPR